MIIQKSWRYASVVSSSANCFLLLSSTCANFNVSRLQILMSANWAHRSFYELNSIIADGNIFRELFRSIVIIANDNRSTLAASGLRFVIKLLWNFLLPHAVSFTIKYSRQLIFLVALLHSLFLFLLAWLLKKIASLDICNFLSGSISCPLSADQSVVILHSALLHRISLLWGKNCFKKGISVKNAWYLMDLM